MKTIYTTLPVYDRLAKQNYEKVKASKLDMLSPIKTPQWRLPSMEWNVEADDPGEITWIDLKNKDGNNISSSFNRYNIWSNNSCPTFNVNNLEVNQVIQSNVAHYIYLHITFWGRVGDIITLSGNFSLAAGSAPSIRCNIAGGALVTQYTAQAGQNDYTWTLAADNYYQIAMGYVAASNYSFTNVSLSLPYSNELFYSNRFKLTDGQNVSYDTFSQSYGDVYIDDLRKTVGAGEETAYLTMTYAPTIAGEILIPGYLINKLRIYYDLTLNSGTAPKIELRDAATGLVTSSNTVTLVAGEHVAYLTPIINTGVDLRVYIFNSDTELVNCNLKIIDSGYISVHPSLYTALTNDYFQYKGGTLGTLLTAGFYYLKFTTADGHIYYSDYFDVDCIYPNLITEWSSTTYETFTSVDTAITSAIETGANGSAESDTFVLTQLENITVIFFHTQNSGQLPTIYLRNTVGWVDSNAIVAGLNVITLTATTADTYYVYLANTAAANFSTSEVLIIRQYSEKYTRINFSNTCDLGDILYEDGLTQSMWLESEPMENTFPLDEEGSKDGYGKFIRSFGRQDKKYLLRTKELPGYMADVIYRIMLHDTIELIDRVGDTHDVYNWDPEHEYLFDDKYYVKFDITFDYDEAFVVGGCCNNLT